MIKRWVEIDPGLAIIGWAIIEDHKPKEPLLLHYGTIETHKEIPTPDSEKLPRR
jgi:crossover junction endodeoxyribonuclease RuvC